MLGGRSASVGRMPSAHDTDRYAIAPTMMLTMKKLKTSTRDLCSPVSPFPPLEYHRVRNPSITRDRATLSSMIALTTVSQKAVESE